MASHIFSFAFAGIQAQIVDVQVQLTQGLPAFTIVGLPDKAVAESRERVRNALSAMGLALPSKRITVNLSPADLQKEGSHFDLPIALAILQAMEILTPASLASHMALGELALDGTLHPVPGILPAAMAALAQGKGLICPASQGVDAQLSGNQQIMAAPSLLALIQHLRGLHPLPPLGEAPPLNTALYPDMADVKGQPIARRALEIAAAGGHHILMIGPPGAGKTMLAQRLPGLLPPLALNQALEVAVIQSLSLPAQGPSAANQLAQSRQRPFRSPHHTISPQAMIGGGQKARPGELALAHHGVLFLDELPEFPRVVLESLRQPLESGATHIARANAHVSYPAQFQLVAAMNPCRCGHLEEPALACGRAPRCAQDYQAKISGPLLDRIDLHIAVQAVDPFQLQQEAGEATAPIAARVAQARQIQATRLQALRRQGADQPDFPKTNAETDGELLTQIAPLDAPCLALLQKAAQRLHLSARGYHRIIRVARTIADLAQEEQIAPDHLAEALSYRRLRAG